MEKSSISTERMKRIFYKLIDYVYEHTIDEEDFYNALTRIIGLTDDEISELEIDIDINIK